MDHRVILKGVWKLHFYFIFVHDIGLQIGTLDISGSLVLNLLSELS